MNILAFIERSEYFQGVSQKNRERLSEICIPKEVAKKEVLFNEGDKGNAFYLLANGAVGIYKGASDGREVVIKVIQPGEIFAEVILFEQSIFPASAVAIKPGVVFTIPKDQFLLLLDNSDFRNDFIGMLMRKQRYLAEKIKYLTMHDVEQRFLIFIREHYGVREKVVTSLSKKDIAAAIGTTPETYSRLLTRLNDQGHIRLEGKTIYITNEFWKILEDSEKR